MRSSTLCNPEPYPLQEVPWESLRPVLVIDGSLASPDIGSLGIHHLTALKDLPEQIQDNKDRDTNIRRDEVCSVEVPSSKDVKSIENDDNQEEDQRYIRLIRLEWSMERHICFSDTLSLERSAESNGGQANADPSEQVGDGRQMQEPVEDHIGATANGQVAEKGEDGREGDADPGKTFPVTLQEYPRRLSILSQPIKVTGTSVEEGIARRCGAGKNHGIDN